MDFEEIVERVANVKKKTGLVTPPEQLPLFIEHQIEGRHYSSASQGWVCQCDTTL